MAVVDVWENRFDSIELPPRIRSALAAAGAGSNISRATGDRTRLSLCGRDACRIRRRDGMRLDLDDLAKAAGAPRQDRAQPVPAAADIDAYRLNRVRRREGDHRRKRADPAVAKSVYARYVGT